MLATLAGCGSHSRDGGGGAAEAYEVPPGLRAPPALSAVPLGSRQVAARPEPGYVRGPLLLTLATEPGAQVVYALRPFTAEDPATDLSSYTSPLFLWPPIKVWAAAVKDGVRGPVASFEYEPDPAAEPAPAALAALRLPPLGSAVHPLSRTIDLEVFAAAAPAVDAPPLDGLAAGWSGQGRQAVVDPAFDVPAGFDAIDASWLQAAEVGGTLHLVLATRGRPTVEPGFTYAFEIGPSNVSPSAFGGGAGFKYRLDVSGGVLGLVDKATGQPAPLSAGSGAVVAEVVEVRIALADLPALAGERELALRAVALAQAGGTVVVDRLEPVFLRSRFAMSRAVVADAAGRTVSVDLMTEPALAGSAFARDYLALARTLVPELERANGIRLGGFGALPLFFVAKEESGYTGLNTSDRGMLTTIGPNTGLMARTQLLAHELAHYQNARSSRLGSRWLQEGMSEWSAERLLYRYFPPRAAHRFMRGLRFDRYFDSLGGALDTFPLDAWTGEATSLGYEKSLMFLDALEHELGQPALLAAFRQAVNETMDSRAFRTYLELATGRDLRPLFDFWVYEGKPAKGFDPYLLYKDTDGDDLSYLDELRLGTDPQRPDTDGDGYPDGEEYFRGMDPLVSAIDPDDTLGDSLLTVHVAGGADDTSAMLRIGGARRASHNFSLDPFTDSPERLYTLPQILRPPYAVAAVSGVDGQSGPVTVLSRGLFVGGAEVDTTPPATGILPPTPRATTSIPAGAAAKAALGTGGAALPLRDAAADLPNALAGYDIVETKVEDLGQTVAVTVKTRAPLSEHGEHGDVVLVFDRITWSQTCAGGAPLCNEQKRQHALSLSQGAVYWYTYAGPVESSALMPEGATVTRSGNSVRVEIDAERLSGWLDGGGEPVACAVTNLTLEGDYRFRERAGCVSLATPGFTRRAAAGADRFGLASHTLELLYGNAAFDETEARHLIDLGHEALRGFEAAAGRPLMERNHWPFHFLRAASTTGAAASRTGAYLTLDGSQSAATRDYLFVEQLARLAMADLLERSGDRPYWVQEAYIQWLTATALYRFYETRAVHGFHEARLARLRCYLANTCPSEYAQDVTLSGWNAGTLSSNGSVKTLAFTLQLDALLGTRAMARIFGVYGNAVPTPAVLLGQLLAVAPDAATAQRVEALWDSYVTGSGDAAADRAAMLAALADADADGLLAFEEEKLGTLDSVADDYLD